MTKRMLVPVMLASVLALLGSQPSAAFEQVGPGVYRIDGKRIDDLLNIRSQADLQVLMLEDNKAKSISDVHMTMLREWVDSGGVLWVAGEGLDSALAQTIAPFRSESFEFVRSSSGKRGGELIVKDVSPRMTIEDHVLTEGVSQLYLFARSKFDGTQRAELLVRMGDTEGNSGWVLVAVPVGRGYLILDGTARRNRWIFGRLKGFDEDHPNSLEHDEGWNSYDWDRLLGNARDHAQQAIVGFRRW